MIDPYKTRLRRIARGIVEGAHLVCEELEGRRVRYHAVFVDLTYRPGAVFEPWQVSQAIECMRKWADRKGYWFRYIWRMEFGEKFGRVHYHLVVWLPVGVMLPKFDKQGWWSHGFTRVERARSPVGYLAKYCSKACSVASDEFDTKSARWWGVGGLVAAVRLRLRIILAPAWVRDKWRAMGEDGLVRRLPFGWWLIGGWEFRSPWEMVSLQGGVKVRWRGWSEWDYALAV